MERNDALPHLGKSLQSGFYQQQNLRCTLNFPLPAIDTLHSRQHICACG